MGTRKMQGKTFLLGTALLVASVMIVAVASASEDPDTDFVAELGDAELQDPEPKAMDPDDYHSECKMMEMATDDDIQAACKDKITKEACDGRAGDWYCAISMPNVDAEQASRKKDGNYWKLEDESGTEVPQSAVTHQACVTDTEGKWTQEDSSGNRLAGASAAWNAKLKRHLDGTRGTCRGVRKGHDEFGMRAKCCTWNEGASKCSYSSNINEQKCTDPFTEETNPMQGLKHGGPDNLKGGDPYGGNPTARATAMETPQMAVEDVN